MPDNIPLSGGICNGATLPADPERNSKVGDLIAIAFRDRRVSGDAALYRVFKNGVARHVGVFHAGYEKDYVDRLAYTDEVVER